MQIGPRWKHARNATTDKWPEQRGTAPGAGSPTRRIVGESPRRDPVTRCLPPSPALPPPPPLAASHCDQAPMMKPVAAAAPDWAATALEPVVI